MEVCLIHQRISYKGGLETRLYNYMNYFLSKGDKVCIITSRISNEVNLPEEVEVIVLDTKSVIKFFRPWVFNKKLAAVLSKRSFDFVLSLERTSHQKFLIAPNTHRGYMVAQNRWLPTPSDLVQLSLDKRSFNAAACIFACSAMVKEEVQTYYQIPADKVKVLHPPLDVKRFNRDLKHTKEEVRKSLGLPLDKKILLLVSTSHKRKGLPFARKLLPLLGPDYLLLVAGSQLHDENGIRFLGFLKDPAVLYLAVDLLIHPAVYEPFGQIVSEAIASGCPVLISSKTGAKDIVKPDVGMVMEEFDTHKWVQTIQSLVDSHFKPASNFAGREALSLEEHMKKMLAMRDAIRRDPPISASIGQ